MKKILVVIGIIALAFIPLNLNASSVNVSISSSANRVSIGETINTKVTVSSSTSFGKVEYYLQYSDNLELISGNAHILDETVSGKKSATYNYKFKAKKSGSAKISIAEKNIQDINYNIMTPVLGTSTVTILNSNPISSNLSSNNNLKSLSIEEYDITPKFNKSVTDYTLNIDKFVNKIKINASVEDEKASVDGIGDLAVKEGENVFEVSCTAENGKVKNYFITVFVEEKNKIEVKIGNKIYRVVKNEDVIVEMAPENYEESTALIKNIEVPILKGSITKLKLVVLRDKNDKYYLFNYDEKTNKFYKYSLLTFDDLQLFVMKTPFLPKNAIKTKIKREEISFNSYKLENEKNKYYLYAMNIDTGKKAWYLYDKKNDSIKKVDLEEPKEVSYKIFAILGSILIVCITLLVLLILKVKKSKVHI